MREIKFRAWHEEKYRMLFVDIESMDAGLMSVKDWDDTIKPFDEEECVIMQYTGLKDKNGKEIYEGDIFRDNENIIREVKWDINCFTVPRVSWIVEVVGNIYENPGLLKTKQKF